MGGVIQVRQCMGFKPPLRFEFVRSGSLFASTEVKNLAPLGSSITHELPVHEIIGRKVKIVLKGPAIVRQNLLSIKKRQYCGDYLFIVFDEQYFTLIAE